MTILVDGQTGERGAYWSQPASANIQFGMYSTLADTCAATAYTRYFGPGKFYKSDQATEVTSLIGGTTCAVPSGNRAVTLITGVDAGYEITADDVLYKRSRLWINIPEIRIDPAVLHNGETISVKIETLNQALGGICLSCVATCECTIDVAKVASYGCTYTISPTSSLLSSSGNTGTVAVTPSSSTCSWTAVSNDSWITITAGSAGTGD
ncbi:MAG TPA: hypothetical protein VIK21_00630, partial [Desulfuromonadaceae bacterium]